MIHFSLPVKALSVNAAWQGRRFKTPAYRAFEKEVFYQLPKLKIKGEVEIIYKFYIKNYGKTDVDNLVKCIQDILCKAKIIEDDRKIVGFLATKIKSAEERIQVEIRKI